MTVTILAGESFANLKETERQKLSTCTSIFKQNFFHLIFFTFKVFVYVFGGLYCSVLATPLLSLLLSPILYF
jgi:hypothetical protein